MCVGHFHENSISNYYFYAVWLQYGLPIWILPFCQFQEIPEFLSSEECDHIIELAGKSGLRTSTSGFQFNYDGNLDRELETAGEEELLEVENYKCQCFVN